MVGGRGFSGVRHRLLNPYPYSNLYYPHMLVGLELDVYEARLEMCIYCTLWYTDLEGRPDSTTDKARFTGPILIYGPTRVCYVMRHIVILAVLYCI